MFMLSFRRILLAAAFFTSAGLISAAGLETASSAIDWRQDPGWLRIHGAQQAASLLKRAEDLAAIGSYKDAAKLYERLETQATVDFNRANCMVLRAECLYADEKFNETVSVLTKALRDHAASVPFSKVLARLRELAERAAAGEGTFLGIRDRRLAIDIYRQIGEVAGTAGISDRLRQAALHAEVKEQDDALRVYREIFRQFPDEPAALDGRLDMAELLISMATVGDGDGRLIREASLQVAEFNRRAPATHPGRGRGGTLQAAVQEQQAANILRLGEFYCRPSHLRPVAARRYLSAVLRDYPETGAAAQAKLLLVILENAGTQPEAGQDAAGKTIATVGATAAAAPETPAATGDAPTARRRAMREPAPRPAPALIGLSGVDAKKAEPPAKAVSGHRRELEQRDEVGRWLRPLEDLELPKEGKPEL